MSTNRKQSILYVSVCPKSVFSLPLAPPTDFKLNYSRVKSMPDELKGNVSFNNLNTNENRAGI